MELLLKYVWFLPIVFNLANVFLLKQRSKKYILENPELEKDYDYYIKKFLIFGNIPWIIIGIGILTGMVDNISEYFRPREMNPIVLVFYASFIVIYIVLIRWIYFKNGAEFIEKNPDFARKTNFGGKKKVTAKQVKMFFPLILLAGIIFMITMWIIDFPIADF
jgi:hypothetical protein